MGLEGRGFQAFELLELTGDEGLDRLYDRVSSSGLLAVLALSIGASWSALVGNPRERLQG